MCVCVGGCMRVCVCVCVCARMLACVAHSTQLRTYRESTWQYSTESNTYTAHVIPV